MISSNDKYSTRRMMSVVQHYCVANSRNLLISSAVIFGIVFLVSLLLSKLLQDNFNSRAVVLLIFYLFISGLIITVLGSLTFSSYSSKPKRITAMMLPAKKSEKFIAMNLVYVVFGNLLLIASLVLSDVITAALFNHRPLINYLIMQLSDSPIEQLDYFIPVSVIGLMLLSQSTFVLGSTLWPKLSFLKTYILQSVVQTVLVIIIPFALVGNALHGLVDIIDAMDLNQADRIRIAWSLIALVYAATAGIYALAWLRFRSLAVSKRFLS